MTAHLTKLAQQAQGSQARSRKLRHEMDEVGAHRRQQERISGAERTRPHC